MREPGFMGLAKQRAKNRQQSAEPQPLSQQQQLLRQQVQAQLAGDIQQRKGMKDKMGAYGEMLMDRENLTQAPMTYSPATCEQETLAYINPEEMQMLRKAGGSGEMTPYGIPSFDKEERSAKEKSESRSSLDKAGESLSAMGGNIAASMGMGRRSGMSSTDRPQTEFGEGGDGGSSRSNRSGGGGSSSGFTQADIDKARSEGKSAGTAEGIKTGTEAGKAEYLTSARGNLAGEYEGYKGEAKELGRKTGEGAERFGDLSGKIEGYSGKFDKLGTCLLYTSPSPRD